MTMFVLDLEPMMIISAFNTISNDSSSSNVSSATTVILKHFRVATVILVGIPE